MSKLHQTPRLIIGEKIGMISFDTIPFGRLRIWNPTLMPVSIGSRSYATLWWNFGESNSTFTCLFSSYLVIPQTLS